MTYLFTALAGIGFTCGALAYTESQFEEAGQTHYLLPKLFLSAFFNALAVACIGWSL